MERLQDLIKEVQLEQPDLITSHYNNFLLLLGDLDNVIKKYDTLVSRSQSVSKVISDNANLISKELTKIHKKASSLVDKMKG